MLDYRPYAHTYTVTLSSQHNPTFQLASADTDTEPNYNNTATRGGVCRLASSY
jgi:hypothetical protein